MKVKTEQEGKLLDALIRLQRAYRQLGNQYCADCGMTEEIEEFEIDNVEQQVLDLINSYSE